MKGPTTGGQRRLYLAVAAILLAGFGSAAAIYLFAENVAQNDMVTEFENSKVYRHELEAYGGKLNVVASDFMGWFNGLWHGRTLAVTVAVITTVVAAGLILVARYLPPDHGTGAEGDDDSTTHP